MDITLLCLPDLLYASDPWHFCGKCSKSYIKYHCHVFTVRRHLHHPVQRISKATAVTELRSLRCPATIACFEEATCEMLWGDVNINQAFHLVSNAPKGGARARVCPYTDVQRNCTNLVTAPLCSITCCRDLCLTRERQRCCGQELHRKYFPLAHFQTKSPLALGQTSVLAAAFPHVLAQISCVSLFFLKYLLPFRAQASVWGRKAPLKVLLRENIWATTASTVEDDCRPKALGSSCSLTYRWFKGKWMNTFLVLAMFWKSCINDAIFDEILVSMNLKQ